MRTVSLRSNGDGTGTLEIVIKNVRVKRNKRGVYMLCAMNERLPQKVRCGNDTLQPHLIIRLYCKVHQRRMIAKEKKKMSMELKQAYRLCPRT